MDRIEKDEIKEKVCKLKEVLKIVEKEVLLVDDAVNVESKKSALDNAKKLEEILNDLEKVLKK